MEETLMPSKTNIEALINVFRIPLHLVISITTPGLTVSRMDLKRKFQASISIQVQTNLSNSDVRMDGQTDRTLVVLSAWLKMVIQFMVLTTSKDKNGAVMIMTFAMADFLKTDRMVTLLPCNSLTFLDVGDLLPLRKFPQLALRAHVPQADTPSHLSLEQGLHQALVTTPHQTLDQLAVLAAPALEMEAPTVVEDQDPKTKEMVQTEVSKSLKSPKCQIVIQATWPTECVRCMDSYDDVFQFKKQRYYHQSTG
jgi:hypothetical protein